jgi:tetratricopeptide (TPR) repeat protein
MDDARDLVAQSREPTPGRPDLDLSGDRPPADLPADLPGAIADRLRRHQPVAAAALAREADRRGTALPWEAADRAAVALLHLGDPASARQLWDRAAAPPSLALRLARMGEAELASLNFAAAARSRLAALERDPRLGEAWFALALLRLQDGDSAATLAACRDGLASPLTDPQRSTLERMLNMASRPAQPRKGMDRTG